MNEPTLAIDHGRARITLNRPDKRNRLEPTDLGAFDAHLQAAAADLSVRVLTIEAEGPSWCSGFHLGALAAGERAPIGFAEVCDRLEALPMPTIAVLGGSVHGGGTDLAVSCDFRVAADGIVLGMPASRIGLQYYPSGLRRFVERIGPAATKRLFLTAETIHADELLRIGYLTEVVEADALKDRIDALCGAIAGLAQQAVAGNKHAIDHLARGNPDMSLLEQRAKASHRASDEHRAAMEALRNR